MGRSNGTNYVINEIWMFDFTLLDNGQKKC